MKTRPAFLSVVVSALFLTLLPYAVASNTWYVDGVNGNDSNNCLSSTTACKTIGHAISLASSGDSVMVAAATYTENLTISFSLKLIGSGASTTIIDGGGVNTVVAVSGSSYPPPPSEHVTLSRVTIRNGSAADGGGVVNSTNLAISKSTITGNNATNAGAGIWNAGNMKMSDSTIVGNQGNNCCLNFLGGGVYNIYGFKGIGGALAIENSTITGNGANGSCSSGGGIFNDFGSVTISNGTISGNSGQCGLGGGIVNYMGATTLQNSIAANNSGGNCYGTMTSNGYNISSDGTCNLTNTGDMNNTEPLLGKLGNHGGPTQTMPEMLTSPTVDAGNPNGCTDSQGHLLTTDQRGYPRPGKYKTDKRCDMGAFERQTD